MKGDLLTLVDAAYEVHLSEPQWLRGLAKQVEGLVPGASFPTAFMFDVSSPRAPVFTHAQTPQDPVPGGVVEACKTVSLCDALLAVAEDRDDDLNVRSSAAHALAQLGDDAVRARLKPFALAADPSDLNDDLKGYALRALWPTQLSITDVLAALAPARARFYGGSYQLFFCYDVVKHATDDDLKVLLAWTNDQGPRVQLPEPARGLLDAVLARAWEKLDEPGIVDAFASAALGRMRHHDAPLVERALHEDVWARDHDKRRGVLRALLQLARSTDDELYRYRQLFGAGDLEWLLGLLNENVGGRGRIFLVAFLRDTLKWTSPFEVVDHLLRASDRHADLAEALGPLLAAVPVDGPVANAARELGARLRAIVTQQGSHERAAIPPPGERVGALLDRFEQGETAAYWQIDLALGVDERGYQRLTILESDVTTLPGWGQIDDPIRRRIVSAASKYLLTGRCSPESWVGKDHQWNPALAGYRALRLLMKEDRATFDELSDSTWREWAPIVAGFPGLDEGRAKGHGLLANAYRRAPEAVLASVLAECTLDDGRLGRTYAYRRLESVWDDRIGQALLALARGSLKPDSLGELLGTLLAHRTPGAVAFAEGLIHLPISLDAEPRARMLTTCASLMRYSLADTWPALHRVITADPAFGREVVSHVASAAEMRVGNLCPPPTSRGGRRTVRRHIRRSVSPVARHAHRFEVLTGAASGENHHLEQYLSTTGAWSSYNDIDNNKVYLWGISADTTNGAVWGWTYADTVYTNDVSGGGLSDYFGSYAGSGVAAASPSNIYSTTGTGCFSDSPAGWCVDYYSGTVPSGAWDSAGYGAWQFAFDNAPACTPTSCPAPTQYVLDSSGGDIGNVWYYFGYPLFRWYQIPDTVCSASGGGTHQFAEIAVKNGIVYALGTYGTVWVYGSPAYPSNCWSKITNPSGETFVSIATDNGFINSVWATDTSGNIWTMN